MCEIKLAKRKCAYKNCNNTFSVYPADNPQLYCCTGCMFDDIDDPKLKRVNVSLKQRHKYTQAKSQKELTWTKEN